MEVSQYGLGVLAGVSVLCGFAAGCVYDAIDAICRNFFKILRHVIDFFFVIACGIVVIIILFDRNDGVFRISVPILFTVGFALYRRITLRPVYRVARFIILIFKRALTAVIKPFRSAAIGLAKKASDRRKPERRKNWAVVVYSPEALYERENESAGYGKAKRGKARNNRTAERQKARR